MAKRWAFVYTALALVYLLTTPLFEASDELRHFGMVEYVREQQTLPVQHPDQGETAWAQEGSQPPLYYALAALVTAPFSLDRLDDMRQLNPHTILGVPGLDHNLNHVLRDTTPPQSAALAVYAARLFSIGLGIVTVIAVFAAARQFVPDQPIAAHIAAGLVALNPMFLFISASVNNDNLVTALSSVVIYLMLLTLNQGFDLRRSALIALLIALATLTKLSGLVLVPAVALVALWIAYRDRDWHGLLALGTMMAAFWALIAGWWYLRNIQLYGELFGTHMMVAVAGPRDGAFTLQTALDEFQGFRWSYWGVFGLFNIIVPYEWFYTLLDVLVLAAGIGLVVALRRQFTVKTAFLLLIVGIGFTAFLNWTAQTYASQGRLLFPYNAAITPLMALGLVTLFRRWAAAPLVPLGAATPLIAVLVIAPVYRIPEPIDHPPDDATPVYARFGDVTLIGYDYHDQRYEPGADFPVMLYWQVDAPTSQDNSLFLHLLNPAGELLARIDTYPGGGRLRTSTWNPGIYADSYTLQIGHEIDGAFPLRLHVGWWHYPTETLIAAQDASGMTIDGVVLDAGGYLADSTTWTGGSLAIDFGNKIVLRDHQMDNDSLTLYWEARAPIDADYRVFVQILDTENTIVDQADTSPPLPTRYWRSGDRFITRHELPLLGSTQSSDNRLILGWYAPDTLERLVVDGGPANAYEP